MNNTENTKTIFNQFAKAHEKEYMDLLLSNNGIFNLFCGLDEKIKTKPYQIEVKNNNLQRVIKCHSCRSCLA